MPNAKIFSKLDATSGFWQLRLDEPSSKLCTFNTRQAQICTFTVWYKVSTGSFPENNFANGFRYRKQL